MLNNVKPKGIPLRSEILCCMWHTLTVMDLMMIKRLTETCRPIELI